MGPGIREWVAPSAILMDLQASVNLQAGAQGCPRLRGPHNPQNPAKMHQVLNQRGCEDVA